MADGEGDRKPETVDLVKVLRHNLEGWRHILIPLDSLLTWKRVYDPAILLSINSLIFFFLWYYQPSILSTFAVVGIVICLADYFVPIISANLFDHSKWNGKNERQYEDICRKLAIVWSRIHRFPTFLNYLKETMPKMYFIVILSILVMVAWIGNLMDNLLLTYFIIDAVLILPGLMHHGILNRYTKSIMDVILKKIGTIKKKKN